MLGVFELLARNSSFILSKMAPCPLTLTIVSISASHIEMQSRIMRGHEFSWDKISPDIFVSRTQLKICHGKASN